MATIAVDATYIFDANPTGTATYSRKLIESLAKLNTSHHFLVCYRLSRIGRRREFLLPATATQTGGPRFSVRLFQEPLTFWLPWQADLFHSLAQRPPAFRFRQEVVTIFDIFPITGRDYSTPEFQRRFSRLLREAVARAGRIVTLSKYTADQLMRHCDVKGERLRVIPAGVNVPEQTIPQEVRLRERQTLVGEGKEMLLTVGALEARKNVVSALRALKFLPERYRLVLAGGNGYGSHAIHGMISSGGLESRVSLLGYVAADRLAVLYQSASALLFPSLEEGFGLPVLEAMACGLPVVTSQTSSLPEVGGDAALYVDPRDPLDIAAKVVSAVEDSRLREELIQKGLARARQFPWSRAAEETLSLYNEMLQ
jgi:glycosyltransferase involved in cell wall biosynthesis